MNKATKKPKRPRNRVGSGELVRRAREDVSERSRITDNTYRVLKWLHPQLEGSNASFVWGMMETWKRWPVCSMPIHESERELLLEVLPNDKAQPRPESGH